MFVTLFGAPTEKKICKKVLGTFINTRKDKNYGSEKHPPPQKTFQMVHCCCLMSSEQYFSYFPDENKLTNNKSWGYQGQGSSGNDLWVGC